MADSQNNEVNDLTPDSEELKFEEEALQEPDSDKLREQIAENLGLDPDEHSEILDKAVAREVEQRKTLGKAIAQKKKYREAAQGGSQPTTPEPAADPKPTEPQDVSKAVRDELEKERLADLDLPDEIKEQVKTIAQNKGIGVREAAKDPYITYLKEQHDSAVKIDAGSGYQRPKSLPAKVDLSKPLNPADFALDTPEGQKAWDEAKAARKKDA